MNLISHGDIKTFPIPSYLKLHNRVNCAIPLMLLAVVGVWECGSLADKTTARPITHNPLRPELQRDELEGGRDIGR